MICIFHHTECMITFFLPILSYFWDIFLSEEDSMYLIFIFICFDHKEIVIPHYRLLFTFLQKLKKYKFAKPVLAYNYNLNLISFSKKKSYRVRHALIDFQVIKRCFRPFYGYFMNRFLKIDL